MAQSFVYPAWVRPLAWGGSAALILVPLALMKAADPNAWAMEDLPFAILLVAVVGIATEVALRLPTRLTRLAGTLLALATALLLVWGNLAVGFAGSEDNPVNRIFFAIPAVALAGSLLARFRPGGVAAALLATAGAQLVAGLIALGAGYFTGPLSVAFAGLWLAAALLFRRSAVEGEAA